MWKLTRSTLYYLYRTSTFTLFTTLLGQALLAEFFNVHVNTIRRAIPAQVFKGYIISTSPLDVSQLESILAGITVQVNRRLPKRIFVYNHTQTTLLHISDTITAFMLLSGLSGAAIRKLCLSPTGL